MGTNPVNQIRRYNRYRMYDHGKPCFDWMYSALTDHSNGRLSILIRIGEPGNPGYPLHNVQVQDMAELNETIRTMEALGYRLHDVVDLDENGSAVLVPADTKTAAQDSNTPNAMATQTADHKTGVYWDVRLPHQWEGDRAGSKTWDDAVETVADSIPDLLTEPIPTLIDDIRRGTSGAVFVEDNLRRAAWAILLLMAMRNLINASMDVLSVEVSTDIGAPVGQARTLGNRLQEEKGTLLALGLDIEALPDSDPFLEAAAKLGLYCPRPDLSSAPTENFFF